MPVTGGTTTAGEILALVRSGRARTRRDVQDLTGISRSTLTLRMTQLLAAGLLREVGQTAGSTGRPAKLLSFDESSQLVLTADLGATHATLAVIDAGGTVIMEAQAEVPIDQPDDTLRIIGRKLIELLGRAHRTLDAVVGVGVGIPGPVRYSTQRPNNPPLMPGWHDAPIVETLTAQLGRPVFVDNDANLMALGEARERYPDVSSLLFVKVGTGIGAGIVLHGQPERGISGGAGDIGHIRLFDADTGHVCTCGARGCLATEASGGAIARMLREEGRPEVAGALEVAALLRDQDPRAIELTRRAGLLLGDVLATSVSLLNPAVVVLGGSIALQGTVLIDAVRERVFERTVPLAHRELFIACSALGADAAVQGARLMVVDQMFSADAVDSRLDAVDEPAQA